MNALSPGYFETMHIPILEGRDFRQSDLVENPTVAIVNRRFAEHFFKGKSAIGKRLGRGGGPKTKLTIEIIGVVENSLVRGASRRRPAAGVRSELGTKQRRVLRPGEDRLIDRIQCDSPRGEAARRDHADIRHEDVEGQLDETLLTDRLIALLSAGFGLLATMLASIGLYGVMAFVVARRRKELGIRLALGAQPGVVIWMVMREVLVLLAIGLAVGIPAAIALGRYVSTVSTASSQAIHGWRRRRWCC